MRLSAVRLPRAFQERLIAAGADLETTVLFCDVRGLCGGAPTSLRAADSDLSAEGLRKRFIALEGGPLAEVLGDRAFCAAQAQELGPALERLLQECPGSEEHLAFRLGVQFASDFGSPTSLIRLADMLGVPHALRVSVWKSRAKHRDAIRMKLATKRDKVIVDQVAAVVLAESPEVFEPVISLARRMCRSRGIVSASSVANTFGAESQIPLSEHEVVAMLRPFAVHLGRQAGEDWFAFLNSDNALLTKLDSQIALFKRASLQAVADLHRRANRDIECAPEPVLLALFDACELVVEGDVIRGLSRSELATRQHDQGDLIQVLRGYAKLAKDRGNARGVIRMELLELLLAEGMRESVARMFLSNKQVFTQSPVYCRPVAPV